MKARDALKIAEVTIEALGPIQQLTQVGGTGATAALAAIGKIVKSLLDGADGKLTPQAVLAQIEAHAEVLTEGVHGSDDAADAAAAAKPGATS